MSKIEETELILLQKIADKNTRRDDLIELYADAISIHPTINWGDLNRAIIDRWSMGALVYIKRKAFANLRRREMPDET